jgi:hypothetical protein
MCSCVDGSVGKTDSVRRDFWGRRWRRRNERESAGAGERTAQESGDAHTARVRDTLAPIIGSRSG